MSTQKETVNIHGKQYETIASRLARWLADTGEDTEYGIDTQVVYHDDARVIVKAVITFKGAIIGAGHGEETRDSTNINRTSALENAETSAIGRALASIGYAGTEYASADEVANALVQQGAVNLNKVIKSVPPKQLSGQITDKQLGLMEIKKTQLQARDKETYILFGEWYKQNYANKPFKQLSKQSASEVIEKLIELTSEPN